MSVAAKRTVNPAMPAAAGWYFAAGRLCTAAIRPRTVAHGAAFVQMEAGANRVRIRSVVVWRLGDREPRAAQPEQRLDARGRHIDRPARARRLDRGGTRGRRDGDDAQAARGPPPARPGLRARPP